MTRFPSEFFWGAACSAYQVEGDNARSDWWHWEKASNRVTPSGAACRHYQFFREDFDLAKSLGHNCHRMSIEWARIQPEAGKFSEAEINHYVLAIDYLRKIGIEPVVTLHHFTNPLWFAKTGGWENLGAREYFLVYVREMVRRLAGKVKYWVTINEPAVYAYYSYLSGDWPPQVRSAAKSSRVFDHLLEAHIAAYRSIHSIYSESNLPSPMVSIAQNMVAFTACRKSLRNDLSVFLRNRLFNLGAIEKLARAKSLDFIGLNYYTRHLIDIRGWSPKEFFTGTCENGHNVLDKNSLGWEIYPQGLYDLLMALKKYRLGIFILENGICTSDDGQRWSFIREHLKKMQAAMADGAKVIGYLYWSLLDNFEWDKGFAPRFGLCEVDYNDFRRIPRGSAVKLAKVISTAALEE